MPFSPMAGVTAPSGPDTISSSAADGRGSGSLRRMLCDIECAHASLLDERHHAVAAALAPHLSRRDLLEGAGCRCSPDAYTRHLLHEGDGYSVLALVWRPGQMSPVHAHRTWCVFGVHCGWMTETFFDRTEAGAEPVACAARRAGDVGGGPASPEAIHRLANLGTEVAISVHVYAARFARLAQEVNLVLAA